MITWSKKMGWRDVQLTLEQPEGVNRIESNPGICASSESLNLTNHGPCSPVCDIHYWKYPCVSGPTQFKPVLFRGLTVLWEGILSSSHWPWKLVSLSPPGTCPYVYIQSPLLHPNPLQHSGSAHADGPLKVFPECFWNCGTSSPRGTRLL